MANFNYICSDAYQRVHKISHKAKIEKKSFVDSYLEGFIGQTRHVCLRETAATAVRECKEFQKRSLFFICCILCLFSQVCNQTIPPPPWLTTGKDTVSSRHCLPTIVTPCQETLSTNSNIVTPCQVGELVQNILSRKFYDGWICQL